MNHGNAAKQAVSSWLAQPACNYVTQEEVKTPLLCRRRRYGTRGTEEEEAKHNGTVSSVSTIIHDFSSKHCATPNYHCTSHSPLSSSPARWPSNEISIVAAAVRSTTETRHQTAGSQGDPRFDSLDV